MSPKIDVSETVFRRLEALGGPLFEPAEVIERLLNQIEGMTSGAAPKVGASAPLGGSKRPPRSRGVELRLDGERISAVSVPDMYMQVLQWLVDGKRIEKVRTSIPFRTSQQRYLISTSPTHPKGNEFVKPIKYKGYYMEAHKNYENALSGLKQFLEPHGYSVTYD
jgi:hypothetical protein